MPRLSGYFLAHTHKDGKLHIVKPCPNHVGHHVAWVSNDQVVDKGDYPKLSLDPTVLIATKDCEVKNA